MWEPANTGLGIQSQCKYRGSPVPFCSLLGRPWVASGFVNLGVSESRYSAGFSIWQFPSAHKNSKTASEREMSHIPSQPLCPWQALKVGTGCLSNVTAAGTISPRAITHPTYQPCLAAKEIHLDKAASDPDNKPLKCQEAQRTALIAAAGPPSPFCRFAGLSPLKQQSHRPAESTCGKSHCAWTHIVLLAKWNFFLFLRVLVLQASQPGQAK